MNGLNTNSPETVITLCPKPLKSLEIHDIDGNKV